MKELIFYLRNKLESNERRFHDFTLFIRILNAERFFKKNYE